MLSPLAKTHRLLQIILIAFLAILFRVWHLGVLQREEKLQEAQKPKERTILLRADRGALWDRFHKPLAINRICYTAAVYYGQIAQIPVSGWGVDPTGQRVRIKLRKEHIHTLSQMLGPLLSLDPERIEDLIHAKASLLPHIPYVIKPDLTEEQYYQLKMLEKDWLGLSAEIASERYYPFGKTGCHLIGSLGSISAKEYRALAQEMAMLQETVDTLESHWGEVPLPIGYESADAVYQRFAELKDKAYTLSDRIGKSGVEGYFEKELRGLWGLKRFEVDQKGKSVRELLGGKEPTPGTDITLSISIELQQFAEELLIRNERERQGKSIGTTSEGRKIQKQPWIKGGSIVALDPLTGEVLACASHPRFDPHDFLRLGKPGAVNRWLENERCVADLWDGHQQWIREWPKGGKIGEEQRDLDWGFFLDQLLPIEGPLRDLVHRCDDVKSAVQIQEDFEALCYFSHGEKPQGVIDALCNQPSPLWESLYSQDKRALSSLCGLLEHIPSAADRLFMIDLFRLAVCSPRFSDPLLASIGSMKIGTYFALSQAFHRIEKQIKEIEAERFHSIEFATWRSLYQKEFLAEKRRKEKEQNTYARPYIDYLDRKERELFRVFWEERRFAILRQHLENSPSDADSKALHDVLLHLPQELREEFLRTFRSFYELDRPLFSTPEKTEKELAASVYPKEGFGFSRSYAYQTSARLSFQAHHCL